MVGLVVEDDDLLLGAQLAADAAHHLVGRLGERARLRPSARIDLVSLRGVAPLAQQEGVVVGDDDAGLAEALQQVGRDEVALAVVVVRVVAAAARAAGRGW